MFMILMFDVRKYGFVHREIWFADRPINIKGVHSIAFMACKKKVNLNDFICQPFTTLVIDLTQDLDSIWRRFDRKSCRYAINRAIKEGIQVKLNADWDKFYMLEKNFRLKKGLPIASHIPDEIKGRGAILFTAYLGGELVAGHIYLKNDEHMRWLRAASKRLEVDRRKATLIGCANRLLIWEAIKYAKEKGIKEFDMGGYYIGPPNEELEKINNFKKSFGGTIVTKYNYFKDYSTIYALIKKINRILSQHLYKLLHNLS
jgi:lipid II:glycine glycyltransferase (peptidoglycan interpeptide bridge formation enzyme)